MVTWGPCFPPIAATFRQFLSNSLSLRIWYQPASAEPALQVEAGVMVLLGACPIFPGKQRKMGSLTEE